MTDEELIKIAMKYSENAYCPYTTFIVGSALLTKSGEVFGGCNVQNAGISSICAEKTAFLKAISEGNKSFKKIAIVGRNAGDKFIETIPCGYCRQFMLEFCDKDFEILTWDEKSNIVNKYKLFDLLPHAFKI